MDLGYFYLTQSGGWSDVLDTEDEIFCRENKELIDKRDAEWKSISEAFWEAFLNLENTPIKINLMGNDVDDRIQEIIDAKEGGEWFGKGKIKRPVTIMALLSAIGAFIYKTLEPIYNIQTALNTEVPLPQDNTTNYILNITNDSGNVVINIIKI